MVKESTLVNLLDNYVSGSRLDCAEAIYMWARGIPNEYASSALRIRYGNGMVYNEVIRDLKKIKVSKPIDRTEDTKFRIDRIIFEFFEEKCLPLILDRMVDGFKAIMVKTKKLMISLARADLLKGGNYVDWNTLWILYRAVFNEELTDFEKNVVIRELLKINVIEYIAEGKVHFPPYIDAIRQELSNLANMPKIEIPDLKEEEGKSWWKVNRETLLKQPFI
ncbi:MAG: hypothetical protein DRJ33_04295 [Candidatus Methanomethylicota archaeon]|uniref:Uncharacterized protein n=1 Tax=Thermoproteota archaeon TaxID=2056631 RepID=A0A497EZY1_9CREN|nr:MAG: hypothetical protein DRJ33_04295 [Candidatus Verstraetearchaeota archaeon]